MAATDKGVWDVQEVRDKQLASEWPIPSSVRDNQTFWTWGANDDGQLAQNNKTNQSSPVQIPGTNWVDVGGVKSDGSLWIWGTNGNGNLGLNDTTNYSSPMQVGTSTDWEVNYRANYIYPPGMAVKIDGTLWSWGYNGKGQLGQNDTVRRSSPTQVGTDTTWPKIRSERKFGWAQSSMSSSLVAIKIDGTLWSWGGNTAGQLGDNSAIQRSSPTQIGTDTDWDKLGSTTGSNVRVASIKTDGTLWVWGSNAYGQLGLNQSPGNAGSQYSSPMQIPGTTWKEVHTSNWNLFATKTDGTLWTVGKATNGQLGTGQNNVDRSSPVQIPGTTWDVPIASASYTGGAIKTDGTLWKWGKNDLGQLAQNDTDQTNSPVQIPGTDWSNVESLAYGGSTWILRTI